MSAPDRRQVRLLFRRLITAEGARVLISRAELESVLGESSAGAVIDRLLAAAGTDKTKMLTATIWLTDMRDFADMNSMWDKWVPKGCAPARACVESRLAVTTIKVEIRIIAAI